MMVELRYPSGIFPRTVETSSIRRTTVSLGQNDESKPRTMQRSPAWKCGQPTNPISQAEALVKLNQVTQVMFGYDASSLSYYSYTTQLEALMQGGSTTGCMAS